MASAVQSALQTSEWPSIIINVLTNLTSYSSQAISHTGCGEELLNWVISKLSQMWHKAMAWQLGFGLLRPQARPKLWAGCDFGWAWPGLAWLLAWGWAMHITNSSVMRPGSVPGRLCMWRQVTYAMFLSRCGFFYDDGEKNIERWILGTILWWTWQKLWPSNSSSFFHSSWWIQCCHACVPHTWWLHGRCQFRKKTAFLLVLIPVNISKFWYHVASSSHPILSICKYHPHRELSNSHRYYKSYTRLVP